ncbi:HNH endonuclease [Luteimicrobium sp. DT211]|uniref:HNH endonuclease n=1 Tax=Luteimicrobium sp. DT211 TaxID=3393412 RepID=UPI003CEABFBB
MSRRHKYTYEILTEAAAHADSLAGVLRYLDVPTRSGSYSHISKRLKELGVDTSHFAPRRRYTREVLQEAAANSDSVAAVPRHLGLVESGGAHAHIGRMLKQLGVDTSHFRRDQGARVRANRLAAADVLIHEPVRTKRRPPHLLRRALLELGRSYSCEACGCDGRWQGAPLMLHVDHISGDFRDNRASNLRFLCPNCHAQTPTFAGRSVKHRGCVAPGEREDGADGQGG